MSDSFYALLGAGFLVGAIVSIVALIDAANHPRWAYDQAGFEKVLWLPDPTGRHELRYWDGARWSEHVSDCGAQSWDRV